MYFHIFRMTQCWEGFLLCLLSAKCLLTLMDFNLKKKKFFFLFRLRASILFFMIIMYRWNASVYEYSEEVSKKSILTKWWFRVP